MDNSENTTQETGEGGSADPPQNIQGPRRKRISGAQQRKRQREREQRGALEATGSTTHSTLTQAATKPRAGKQPPQGGSSQPGSSGSQDKKRLRSDGSSEVSPRGQPKRRAMEQPSTSAPLKYSEVIASHLRVAVIDKQDWDSSSLGRLSATQVELLQGELAKRLDNTLFSGKQVAPIFRSTSYSQETLKFTCENDSSLDWLKNTICSLPPLWEGANLDVVPVDQLPKLTKVTLWIPGNPVETGVILRRLAAQNPWAKIEEWINFHTVTRSDPKGIVLLFGVREAIEKDLRSRGGRLNYMFTSHTVKIHQAVTSTESREAGLPTPMEEGEPETANPETTSIEPEKSQSTPGCPATEVDSEQLFGTSNGGQ